MEQIHIIINGEHTKAMMARITGDVPEIKVGDNYYCPIANAEIIKRLGLPKPTPQTILKHPEIWMHMGHNEGNKEIITDTEYKERLRASWEAGDAKLRAACPGINELRAAYDDVERYHREFNRMMEDGDNDGVRPPRAIRGDVDALRAQYPIAAAYLKAESWSFADHYAKSGAGRRAMERIISGEPYDVVLADMEREWSEHCNAHIWD